MSDTLLRSPVSCSSCSLRDLCMPGGLQPHELSRLDGLVATRRRVRRRGALFRQDDPFTSLFAVRSGVFKTCVTADDGREQVTGFQLAGEIIGMDAIVGDRHPCNAVALEDAEVCVLPFERVGELARKIPGLQRNLHRIMSGEIVREQSVMLLLGTRTAEERLAAFLLNLTQRLQARGFSCSELVLRMTREEIGSYLGLTLETVSRTLSRFAEKGLVQVRHRHVQILERGQLQAMIDAAHP